MFATEGWKHLIADVIDKRDSITIDSVGTLEQLYYSKGQLSVMDLLLNYKTYIGDALNATEDV